MARVKRSRSAWRPPVAVTHACLKGGFLKGTKTEAPLGTMTFEDITFVKIGKNSPWLALAVTGHTFSRSRIRDSEFIDALRARVKKERDRALEEARKMAKTKDRKDDRMASLTKGLRSKTKPKAKPSRLRGVNAAAMKLAAQVVKLKVRVLPDQTATLERWFFYAAKQQGGRPVLWLRLEDVPWLVCYLHSECGETSSDETSSCSSSYDVVHYNPTQCEVRIQIKLADGKVKHKRRRVMAESGQYVAKKEEVKAQMLAWATGYKTKEGDKEQDDEKQDDKEEDDEKTQDDEEETQDKEQEETDEDEESGDGEEEEGSATDNVSDEEEDEGSDE
jgi:hypothetical protein